MRFLHLSFALLTISAVAATALAHEDVVPYPINGKIGTGGHDDGLETNNIVQRVFGYDFGEDPLDIPNTYFAGDPGFNNDAIQGLFIFPNDGLLPANKTLGFNVLSNLSFWDGSPGVSFVPAPANVVLGIQRGASTVNISGTGVSGTVPTLGGTGAAGRLHEHLGSFLNFTDGIDPTPPNAPNGIYMVGIELKLPGSGLANSDSIYIVYNNHVDEGLHDQAIEWVEANLVPEPATWAMMSIAVGALAVVARRRRKRGQSMR